MIKKKVDVEVKTWSRCRSKRIKERTIAEVIDKVTTWRKLYYGIMMPVHDTGKMEIIRFSLDQAAEKVGVSKKSLDDYLLQLRFGSKFNFDFEKHKNEKVGKLRQMVNRRSEHSGKNKNLEF